MVPTESLKALKCVTSGRPSGEDVEFFCWCWWWLRLGYWTAGSVLPKDGDEIFWMSLACGEGLQKANLGSCVLLKRNLLLWPFWYPSHCFPEQSHLRGATTWLPLICTALLGPVATLALGMGTWSGSTRQFLFLTTEIRSRMGSNPNRPCAPRFCLKL